ncbi:MAG: tail fiber domain-containing protein [Candidatus Aminicenantes bacterium]|nr:tail fiber domain-containing protein [Candidatus Aminicenantes bacterium]
MKRKIILSVTFVFMFLLVSFWGMAEEAGNNPVAVSPGSETEAVTVWQSCPTFSWTSVDRAASYRIAVFEAIDPIVTPYEDMADKASPVISKDIPGPALSWTLSAEESLKSGSMYVWYVQALDATGNAPGLWSGGRFFKVEQEIRFAGVEEKLAEKLRDYGVNEETITNVLKDITSDVKEVVVRSGGTEGKNTPDVSRAQGTEGSTNTFYGQGAGYSNTSGTGATFIGINAGYSNTEGIDNTFLGRSAGRNNTTGSDNTFAGQAAGYQNTTGNANTFLGYYAGFQNTSGYDNTFVGESAGYNNIGNWNIFVGKSAGFYNTGGGGNIFIGNSSGHSNTSGSSNTFIGKSSGYSTTTANNNIFIGEQAGYTNTTGYDNIFIGNGVGYSNITGCGNIIYGHLAGFKNTTGSYNVFFGSSSGNWNTTGGWNTFIGNGTGRSNTTGIKNVFLGLGAGYLNSIGEKNVFLGFNAGYNETGSNKLYIANSDTSSPLIYGEFDNGIVTVNGKLGIGTKTPGYTMEVDTTGSNSCIVVKRTDGASNYINATDAYANFGSVTNHPLRLVVNSTWKMRLNQDGSLSMSNGASLTTGGVWTNASSRALKENIENLNADEAVAALTKLNPVKYNYKIDKTDKHVGFIAEDVPELVATADRKGLSPMDVVAVLTKVIQEQQKMNENQQKTIADLQERIAKIERAK